MPLIILTGYPCSGLSYRARQLATLFDEIQSSQPVDSKARYKIHIVDSHDAAHPRTVYDTAKSEKQARAVVYGRVKRLLARDTIVIVDGMNYIKGWRYQLWCESKEAGTTCSVVHVGTPVDQCTAINEARLKRKVDRESKAEGALPKVGEESSDTTTSEMELADNEEPYPPELFSNLIFRYEEPSTSSRWDKPLFTVPWSDPQPPVDEIWSAITGTPRQPVPSNVTGLLRSSNSIPESTAASTASAVAPSATSGGSRFTSTQTRTSRPKIVPHQATMQPVTMDPNTLYALEKRTSEIISAIRTFTLSHPTITSAVAAGDTEDGFSISVPNTESRVVVPSHVLTASSTEELAGAGGLLALPRLQRLRRQWVGLNRALVGGRGPSQSAMTPERVGDAFVRFLNAEFEGMSGDLS